MNRKGTDLFNYSKLVSINKSVPFSIAEFGELARKEED
jgi:hypothetical protein